MSKIDDTKLAGAKDFIKANATQDKDDRLELVQSSYDKLLDETFGITPEMQKKVAAGHKTAINAAGLVLADQLEADITTAKAAGDDWKGLTREGVVRTHFGQQNLTVIAHDENPNPRDRTQTVESFGRFGARVKSNAFVDKTVAKQISDQIKKAGGA